MIKEIKNVLREFSVSNKQLSLFGYVSAVVIGLVYIAHGGVGWMAVAVLFAVLGLFKPQSLLPVVKALIAATYPIGWVVSRVLLTIFYVCILTPIGIMYRMFEGSKWSVDPTVKTYWEDVEENLHHDKMSL